MKRPQSRQEEMKGTSGQFILESQPVLPRSSQHLLGTADIRPRVPAHKKLVFQLRRDWGNKPRALINAIKIK